jgi:hypothetical protein
MIGKGALTRKVALKRKTPLRHRRASESPAERRAHELFVAAAGGQQKCANCESEGRWHPHHAGVEKQELKRLGLPLWDPANALRLCLLCHWRHHYEPGFQLSLTVLWAANIRYAFAVLGPRAYDYLHRHYDGQDARVERALAKSQRAAPCRQREPAPLRGRAR